MHGMSHSAWNVTQRMECHITQLLQELTRWEQERRAEFTAMQASHPLGQPWLLLLVILDQHGWVLTCNDNAKSSGLGSTTFLVPSCMHSLPGKQRQLNVQAPMCRMRSCAWRQPFMNATSLCGWRWPRSSMHPRAAGCPEAAPSLLCETQAVVFVHHLLEATRQG